MSQRIFIESDQRHVRADVRHEVPRVPIGRILSDRVDVLADVAHVHGDGVPIIRRTIG
jgi:hypothetical protein